MDRNKLGQFVKGHKSGMTGKKQTESRNKKFSEKMRGHTFWGGENAKETQFKRGVRTSPGTEFKAGQVSWNKGLGTNIDHSFRMSKPYANWRIAVFVRDDYTCQICKVRGGKIIADHIKSYALYPELRVSLENGRALCYPCHLKTDTFGFKILKLRKEINYDYKS